jgi:glucoamylase
VTLEFLSGPSAPGGPGVPPNWAPGCKQAVGTSVDPRSTVWFTVAEGVLTELYYPRVDIANTRDLQFLIAGAGGRFWEERRDLRAAVSAPDPRALLCDVVTAEPEGAFVIAKRVLCHPELPVVLVRTTFTPAAGGDYRLFLLLAPHMEDRGTHNHARLVRYGGRLMLTAWRHSHHLALACSSELPYASCGFVGTSDGWQDVRAHGDLTARFVTAEDGNVALCARVAAVAGEPFTVAVGFGEDLAAACAAAAAALAEPYAEVERRYRAGWNAYCAQLTDLSDQAGDGGALYYRSVMILKAHEDKANPGAHIASLAVPWGEAAGDANAGGYHLVWPRDLYHVATARLAVGDGEAALAALRYLERTQRADGSWPQNFWVYGEPYWRGLQLDEIAFPVLLAWQVDRAGVARHNPYPSLVRDAAYAIARIGPVTPQERWEENSGYSPSTLAAAIAALVCAADFARRNGDPAAAVYFLDTADYWASRIEDWTYTTAGTIPGFHAYYERIAPVLPGGEVVEGVGGRSTQVLVPVANLPPELGQLSECSVVDGGFLELVRYGVRAADDPRVVTSLAAYDAVCRVETPFGPCWRRYNHDGYGQKADGGPYDGTGVGRAWPLLTGERAHYELAAGRDVTPLVRALEAFAGPGGILPEQVWDSDDIPERGMFRGRPTGAAAPLCWAHAEYVKLLRSRRDGQVFDCPAPVRERYLRQGRQSELTIWKFNHKVRNAPASRRLRIEVYGPAALHWTDDGWRSVRHEPLRPLGHGVWIYEFAPGSVPAGRVLEFTFYWSEGRRWEGSNFAVAMQ